MQRNINPHFNKVDFLLWIVFILPAFNLWSQAHDVYLTGNILDLEDEKSVYQSLNNEFAQSTNDFTLVLNGDHVDHLIEDGHSDIQVARLFRLIDFVAQYKLGKMVILTGDRDWNNNRVYGIDALIKVENAIEDYISDKKYKNIFLLSKNGCPGPYQIELDLHLLMVSVNSQWWNHKYNKAIPADAICEHTTTHEVIEELEGIIDENYNKNVLFVAHHPIKSLGNYGGRFSFVDHLKPFPVIGSFVNAHRQHIGSKKDLSNEKIKEYIDEITNLLFFRSDLIMATSHEKNQQIMKFGNNYLINSGAMESGSYAGSDHTTNLSEKTPGIIKLEYRYDGAINAHFLRLDKNIKSFVHEEEQMLYASACLPGQLKMDIDENLSYLSCQLIEELPIDSTADLSKLEHVKAGPQYNLKAFGRFWMGDHYRDEWSTSVGVNYLNVDTTFSGLEALKMGGGKQTLSLKFRSQTGDYYTFRSVDKDPSRTLNYRLRYTILGEIFKDQTSAQHPYGALVISDLLDSLGILHVHPKLYLMPNITALGPFQKKYGDMLGMIERNPGKANNTGAYFGEADDILKSHDLFRKMFKSKKHQINEEEYLRARLFDILVGDWSRHEDKWKWAAYDQDSVITYRPIPLDRDHVFAKWDGLLPSLADREWGLPSTENFDYKIKGFKSLVYQARYMDRFLLAESGKQDYIDQAKLIQNLITDTNIELSVKRLPPEIYDISGEEITQKLKQRKRDLVEYAERFHEWLSKDVEILGSTEKDYIEISGNDDGGIFVKIFDDSDHQKGEHLFYHNSFYPEQTEQIRIYGLGEDDDFEVCLPEDNKIKIVLIGGYGDDTYISHGGKEDVKIYDLHISNPEAAEEHFKVASHWNVKNYQYDRNRLKFDHYIPLINLGYSSYDGFTFGGGAYWKKNKWYKSDYHIKHQLSGSLSTKGNIGISYSMKLKEAWKKLDLISEVVLFNPEFYNAFYGIGNGTTLEENLNVDGYYVTNYNKYSATVGLSRKFWKKSYINISTGIQAYSSKEVENSILQLSEGTLRGVHRTLSMIPFLTSLELDFRDHGVFPKRGIRTVISNSHYRIFNSPQKQWHGMTEGFLEYYVSTYGAHPLTLGLKIGGSMGYGDVPYYQLPHLGNKSGLRGYTSFRFTGRSRFYFNSELRWALFELDKTIANEVGISVFYDKGRIYDTREDALTLNRFHSSYGGGFYITPAFRSFTLSVQFAWSDENSFYPVIGLGTVLK